MRNHNDKTRDIARSVLPSTARKGARETRALIHGRERAKQRVVLHELGHDIDPDDVDTDVGSVLRRDLAEMVEDRRGADKLGPLLRWASRVIERDPALAAASPEDREVYFRSLLPRGVIGNHAISHLRWILEDRPRRLGRGRAGARSSDPDVEVVSAIVAAGGHGELNRRIRRGVAAFVTIAVRLPPERVIDDAHPAPGILLPARTVSEHQRRRVRFLGGAHDVDAFVKDAGGDVLNVARALHRELIGADRTGRR